MIQKYDTFTVRSVQMLKFSIVFKKFVVVDDINVLMLHVPPHVLFLAHVDTGVVFAKHLMMGATF